MAKRIPSITLLHSIVCDDIRREDNGKFILIGVYPELIILNAIPAQIILGIWLQFKMQLFEKTTLQFEIRGDAIQDPMPFSLEIGDENFFGKLEAVPLIVKLPFTIKSAGSFTIYFRKQGDAEWQPAQTVQVQHNATKQFLQ
ncbi:MAG TPA: hypothetical protein VLG38_07635 [Gammaproteobacteria bacterium]|nr:hypothetical protein [Gammaproteobacteria bacterium]